MRSIPGDHSIRLAATWLKAQISAEEEQYMILKTVRHLARMSSAINLETICDSVLVESLMQLASVSAQTILVADIESDSAVLPQISDVLIDESQERVCCPLREHV